MLSVPASTWLVRFESPQERAFGVDLSNVRVHTDEAARSIARQTSARAFTVGNHIGFGAGQYQPGTPRGDALLAHEIAHTRQQISGASESGAVGAHESDATRMAVEAGRHLEGRGEAPRPRRQAGLSLQRCGDDDGPTVPAAPTTLSDGDTDILAACGAADTTPANDTSSSGPAGNVDATAVDDGLPEDLSDWDWTTETDTTRAVILVGSVPGSSQPHLFMVPAAGFMRNGRSRGGGAATPQRGPVVRMPAMGHAGAHLVHTSHGVAAMVDVGGNRTGSASAVQVSSLQAVAARFGMATINQIIPSHTHADHVANLTSLVRAGVVRAADVHVNPGMQNTTAGPLGRVLTELRTAQHSAAGFGPSWTPTQLQVTEVPGPGGAATMRSELRIGGVVFNTVVDSGQMRSFVQALQANDWSRATRFADGASLMTRIRTTQGGPDMLVSGDMRGRDILRLQRAMGDQAFRDFVGQSRTLSGLHHLGAVSTRSDVQGLQTLLRAMGVGSNELTVVAQTGSRGEINMTLVRALQRAGVRVVALTEAQGRADQQITVSGTGRVQGQRASEWTADEVTRSTRTRIRNMERAITAIESTPTYRAGEQVSREQIMSGLRAEVARLRGLVEARMETSTNELTSATRNANATQRLAANEAALRQVSASETTLGQSELQRLARSAEAAGQLASQLRQAQRGGYARHEVRRLLFQVDPGTARRIMAEELGGPQSRRQQRRGWRNAARRLRRQAEVNRIVQSSGGGTPRARGVAWFGLALEAWNLASPFIADAVNDSRDTDRRDFYLFWRDLTWWQEKGLRPPYRAIVGGQQLTPEQVEPGIQRRVHDDVPEDQRPRTLTDEVRNATAVEQFYIPAVDQWPESLQRTFWTTLMLWVSTHVNDYDDYSAEISDLSWAPIRQDPASGSGFGERNWQMRVGVLDDDGHVQERWQDSTDLTRIMNAAANRIVTTTTAQLGEKWAHRGEGRGSHDVISAPGTVLAPQRHEQPTAIRTFARGNRAVYARFGAGVSRLHWFRFWSDEPRFFLHAGMEAPPGHVWVSGADYNTAAAIRSQDTYSPEAQIRIPKQPTRALPGEVLPPTAFEDYMNENEMFAWRAYADRRSGFGFNATPDDRFYRGWVTYYERNPNESGLVLVETDALSRSDVAPSSMPWHANRAGN